jgi:hypothetical protein
MNGVSSWHATVKVTARIIERSAGNFMLYLAAERWTSPAARRAVRWRDVLAVASRITTAINFVSD